MIAFGAAGTGAGAGGGGGGGGGGGISRCDLRLAVPLIVVAATVSGGGGVRQRTGDASAGSIAKVTGGGEDAPINPGKAARTMRRRSMTPPVQDRHALTLRMRDQAGAGH